MKTKFKKVIEEYQCPGCISGCDISCYEKAGYSVACSKHRAGTVVSCIGKIFLGMPAGFNRLGVGLGGDENMPIEIFELFGDDYDTFNIPVWKYLNKNGHTLVRGIKPRLNQPFLHIFLEDCMSDVDCLEITQEQINNMD